MKMTALLAVLLAAPAAAADRTGELSLSASGGGALPLGPKSVSEHAALGPDYGLALRWGMSEHVEGQLSYDSVQMYETRRLRLQPVLVSLLHVYDRGGYFAPAVRVGVGPVRVDEARPGPNRTHNSFALRGGVGAEYSLTPAWALGAWADYLYAARGSASNREVHAATFNLSLTRRLGKLSARRPKA